jgi:ferrous iron transport protein B
MDQFKIALVGNPNCGKTTLFNNLTGSNHYVGNWAGVTVEKKIGNVTYDNHTVEIVDLPGIYSLSPYSLEEKVSRNYLLEDEADLILNIVDSSYLERNLYLTLQLIEMGKPVVLALNMMDEAERKNIKIDVKQLSKVLGIPVVPISALKNKGIRELLRTVVEVHHHKELYKPKVLCYDTPIECMIEDIEKLVECDCGVSKRWVALKVIEQDEDIAKLAGVSIEEAPQNGEMILSEARYKKIAELIGESVDMSAMKQDKLTQTLDKWLLNKLVGLPLFGFVMWLMFYLTFNVGGYFAEWVELFFSNWFGPFVSEVLVKLEVASWMQSLIVDGIIGGVGGILTFVPNIAILFIIISILEDSGYMARVAYLMDFWMSKVGLNGKSFIPMILGFGCNVPAIMSTRTVENENDRLITILVNPFMSCGARFPVYVLFAGAFFPGQETLVTFSLYLLGVFMALFCAFIFRRTLFKGEDTLFIMEFPPYRIPSLKSLGIHVWERVQGYLTKAGTVILGASIILWVILNFNTTGMVAITDSFGASFGSFMAPIFAPLGFGSWQAALSLITGIVAKEIVVANMLIVYGLSDSVSAADFALTMGQSFNQLTAYVFMVFVLLYTPCVGVIGVIKRETNSWKWTIFSVVYQFTVAWVVAFIVYRIGLFLGLA